MALICLACSGALGCAADPFVRGHTGPRAQPLPEAAAVSVLGADAEDPTQMDSFDAALAQARASATPLGTSSFVAGGAFRDEHAARAARRLGANRVLYTFAYRTATVEQTQSPGFGFPVHSRAGDDSVFVYNPPTTDSDTRHWWQYRAYFFRD